MTRRLWPLSLIANKRPRFSSRRTSNETRRCPALSSVQRYRVRVRGRVTAQLIANRVRPAPLGKSSLSEDAAANFRGPNRDRRHVISRCTASRRIRNRGAGFRVHFARETMSFTGAERLPRNGQQKMERKGVQMKAGETAML